MPLNTVLQMPPTTWWWALTDDCRDVVTLVSTLLSTVHTDYWTYAMMGCTHCHHST